MNKVFISISLILSLVLNGVAQFTDDFSGYTTQVEADNMWSSSDITCNGCLRVNPTSDQLDFNMSRDATNHSIALDLQSVIGSNADNNQWVLRIHKLRFSNQGPPPPVPVFFVGLSDQDENTSSSANQDFIGFEYRYDSSPVNHYMCASKSDNGVMFDQCDGTTNYAFQNATDYYIEVIRSSSIGYQVDVYDDPDFSNLLVSNSGTLTASITNLRYIVIRSLVASPSTANIQGTIDAVQFCNGTSTFTCSLLPMELVYFSAQWNDEEHNSAIIRWETANEINNDYFEIERSIDAINFTSIMTVDGAGNSSQNISYQELDLSPYKDGTSYYRLKQVDFNGDYSYSQIETLNVPEGVDIINLYPNPVINNLHFTVLSSVSSESNIIITNSIGQIVKMENRLINDGLTTVDIDTQFLSNGNYYIELVTQDSKYKVQRKFIVNKRL